MKKSILSFGIMALVMMMFGCSDDSSDSLGANRNSLSLVDTDIVWDLSVNYNQCVKSHEVFYLERDTLDQEGAMAMYQAMASYPVELYPACENEIVDAVNSMVECSLSKGLCADSSRQDVNPIHDECRNLPKVIKASECILKEAKEVSNYEVLMDGYCKRSNECARDRDPLDDSFGYDECMKYRKMDLKEKQEDEAKGKIPSGCYNLFLQVKSEKFIINQKMYDAHQCEGVFYDDEDSSKMSFMREEHLLSMKTIDTLWPFYKAVCLSH